jgi:hypothetical protein
LQGCLYLAAYDPRRRTFGGANPRLLELALRAAGLTDLYLQGHLIDVAGRPRRAGAPPATASLRSMWDQVPPDTARTWARVISSEPRVSAATLVGAELHTSGWLCERRRRLAVMPGRRWQPADTAATDQAGEEARQALAGIVAQQPGAALSHALGLLAFHAQLPATISVNDDARSRAVLVQANAGAVAPLAGLAEAIQTYFAKVRAEQSFGAT